MFAAWMPSVAVSCSTSSSSSFVAPSSMARRMWTRAPGS